MATLIGTTWKHKKRGTTYRVIGVIGADLSEFKDMDEVYWCDVLIPPGHRMSIRKSIPAWQEGCTLVFAIPMRMQIEITRVLEIVVIYQCLEDGTIWGRPEDEFMWEGRFERIEP
jgi:hypothetical protein